MHPTLDKARAGAGEMGAARVEFRAGLADPSSALESGTQGFGLRARKS